MFSSPVWVRGCARLPRFFCYKGLFVFFIQKNRIIDYEKKYFYTIFCFLITFSRPSHIRAKVSKSLFSFKF
ncbi:hypothetical protein BREVNS_0841 [Brevinematales bacterium NS]|nr:hypothetical protein BREVNS_0841 [Brevinematales bacterium NS]